MFEAASFLSHCSAHILHSARVLTTSYQTLQMNAACDVVSPLVTCYYQVSYAYVTIAI